MKSVVLFLKKRNIKIFLFILLFFFISSFPSYKIFAQVMQSGTYKMTFDSINVGGEDVSGSSIYRLGDTLGELGTGDSSSTTYQMHAGFWQMEESSISISSPSDLALTSIGGILGDGSEGVVSWNVLTDNSAGYSMSIKTTTTPALTSSLDSFDDYTPSGANPDYDFSILSSTSAFGFSPEGSDTVVRFKDDGVSCNINTGETSGKCWDGLSTTDQDIALKTSSNQPSGSTVDVRFRAESGSSHIQTSGNYSATIVVTAITL